MISIQRSFKRELTAKWTIEESVRSAVIAALYTVLTMLLAPLAYGTIQFRISEMLAMLPYDRRYGGRGAVVGIFVGSTIVAFLSPHGVYDLLLNIIGCCITLPLMWWLGVKFQGSDNGKLIAGLIFSLIVTFQVGYILLHLMFGCPLAESIPGVLIGELVTVVGFGYALLKALEKTYKKKEIKPNAN